MSNGQWSYQHGFMDFTPRAPRSPSPEIGSGRVRDERPPAGAISFAGTGVVSGIDPNDKISDNIVKRDLTPGTGAGLPQSQVAGTAVNRNTAPAARVGSFTSPRVTPSGSRIGTASPPNDTSGVPLAGGGTPARTSRTTHSRAQALVARSNRENGRLGNPTADPGITQAVTSPSTGGLNLGGGSLSLGGASVRLPQASYPRFHGMSGSRHSHGMSNCNYEKK